MRSTGIRKSTGALTDGVGAGQSSTAGSRRLETDPNDVRGEKRRCSTKKRPSR